MVVLDPTSALAMQGINARTVLFTELGAGGQKGIMRTVSIIDSKWIKSYLPRTKDIDVFRLAGISFDTKRDAKGQKEEESEEDKVKRQLEERQRKI